MFGNYNPYYIPNRSILGGLFGRSGIRGAIGKFSLGNFLTGTQKTLGVINQAIPLINQAKPLWNNAKTLFKIADAMKEPKKSVYSNTTNTSPTNKAEQNSTISNNKINLTNNPQFFV